MGHNSSSSTLGTKTGFSNLAPAPRLVSKNPYSMLSSNNRFLRPAPPVPSSRLFMSEYSGDGQWGGGSGAGRMVTVEFTIRNDGTITETVKGALGEECVKVTEKIN